MPPRLDLVLIRYLGDYEFGMNLEGGMHIFINNEWRFPLYPNEEIHWQPLPAPPHD
ncbi:DUF551 domain-containing protein [Pectobacterium parmentieri]